MTIDDLMKAILEILPNAEVGDDNDGQIIIFTNKHIVNDELEEM